MQKKQKAKSSGKTIAISAEAYEVLFKEAKNAKPRRTLREQINLLTKVPLAA